MARNASVSRPHLRAQRWSSRGAAGAYGGQAAYDRIMDGKGMHVHMQPCLRSIYLSLYVFRDILLSYYVRSHSKKF